MKIGKTKLLVLCLTNLCAFSNVYAVTSSSAPVNSGWKDMPQTESFDAGRYLGASIGIQQNITGAPANYTGLAGTLSAGWGHLWNNRYYLAGEVFGGTSANLKNRPAVGTDFGVQSGWNYGADILPGFMLTDTVLGYLRLGVINTRFTNMNSYRTGGQIGLGGQTNIYKNIDLRAEYVFSSYQKLALIGKPQVNQFNLGIVQTFM